MVSMEDEGQMKLRLPLAVLLLAIAIGGSIDVILDAPITGRSAHVFYEVAMIIVTLGFSAWLWLGWRRQERSNVVLRRQVLERQAECDRWRAGAEDALAGFAVAIDRQLEVWGLTNAEREVVMLLLKGKAHKEIAAATDRSEKTVRQHAAAAYRKAGLGGRAELAAYFLSGLPTPKTVTASR
jgi:DNA-binding CsgD family transcriptional regulator